MATILFLWNPQKWNWSDFPDIVLRSEQGEPVFERWSCGNRRTVSAGSRAYLVRVGTERGIIASGTTLREVYRGAHWSSEADSDTYYADIAWDTILDPSEALLLSHLAAVRGVPWNDLYASGVQVPESSTEALERLWKEHLEGIGRQRATLDALLPHELIDSEVLREGAARTITVNANERNSQARRRCTEHYGTVCAVCGFDFGTFYGQLGDGYIHVHQLRDLATIGDEYVVDPINDLRPVCPNCHAMLHRRVPAMTIEELKQIIGIH